MAVNICQMQRQLINTQTGQNMLDYFLHNVKSEAFHLNYKLLAQDLPHLAKDFSTELE